MSRKLKSLNELNNVFLLRLVTVVAVLSLLVVAVCAFVVISSERAGIAATDSPVGETSDAVETVMEEPEETPHESGALEEDEADTASDMEDDSAEELPFYDTFIFVGDSRFVAMSSFADEEDTFVCETGVSLSFLKNHYSAIRSYESGNCAVIIGLGVNNLTQAPEYIEFLNENRFQSDTYFLSVNPTEPGKEYSITDEAVRAFNEKMEAGAGISYTYINTYDKLVEHGYSTQDGVHYYDSTTEYLHKLIKSYFGYDDDSSNPLWNDSRSSEWYDKGGRNPSLYESSNRLM